MFFLAVGMKLVAEEHKEIVEVKLNFCGSAHNHMAQLLL